MRVRLAALSLLCLFGVIPSTALRAQSPPPGAISGQADLASLVDLGNSQRNAGQYSACVETSNKAIALLAKPTRDNFEIFYLRGICSDRRGDWAAAEEDFRTALELYPNQPEVLNYLAYSWVEQGVHLDDALRMLRSAAEQRPDDGNILDSLGWANYRLGNSQDAVQYLERAYKLLPDSSDIAEHLLAIKEKTLGPDHPDVATALSDLAGHYDDQARYAEAEPLYKRALVIREKTLGPDHPDVAQLLNNLAVLYDDQGRYAEAEPLYKRALAIREGTLGPDHLDIAQSLNNLALLYDHQGRYAEAEPLLKRSLAVREKTLGPDHPDVAEVLNNLAELYRNQSRYAEAEALDKRTLAIREKALGPDHVDVAQSLTNLALLYKARGRHTDAEPLYKRALTIYEKVLGPSHPWVGTAVHNLAALYDDQGRYADAEPLYKQALTIREKALGPEHPYVALSLNDLAVLYWTQGRYAEAEPLYKRALAIEEKVLGPGHPEVAHTLHNLASFYDGQDRYAEAEPLYKRALAIKEKALGPEHPDVAWSLSNLAGLYRNQGRYAEAEPLYKRALAIREKVLGPDHPEVAVALNGLALIYWKQGRSADAEPLYKRALAIREKALGPDHPDVAEALNNLALLYNQQSRYAAAEPLYKRALTIQEKAFGPDHSRIATALNNLALLYHNQGRYAEAEPLYKQSLAIREKALGPDHSYVAVALNNLADLYRNQRRYAEAEPLFKRALAIREKALGPDHPDVAQSLNDLAALYDDQKRYGAAIPLVRMAVEHKGAATWAALPVLFGAQAEKLVPSGEAFDEGINVVQRVSQTSAGEALNALAARFSAGTDLLAQLVRQDQDLASEAVGLDKAILAAMSKDSSKRDDAAERYIRDRITAIARERDDLSKRLSQDFPDYAALSRPEPLTASDIRPLLSGDEALIVVHLDNKKSYVWVLTRDAAEWQELAITANEVSKVVWALRSTLRFDTASPFDPQASFTLYQKILAPVENTFGGKPRLSLVLDGALTSLPPQLLVTRDPTGKELKDADWLIRTHAVTVLPSIASLKVLRGKSTIADAIKPLIGFADPVFDQSPVQLTENTRAIANITATRGIRGTVADLAELRTALSRLPETASELRKIAATVHADAADLFVGADATETRVKQAALDQFRIVYFATHGLLAGDVADFAKLNAEPALVLSFPEHPSQLDDGILTASEVAQLKLNADWVVLSACNTASAEKPGAEALSGLARAFFYAGARSLVISNWEVDSDSTVALMTGTFAALAADPKLSHAEALQKSMLAMIDNAQRPDWADPKYWAPFIVVGEPRKPAN